MLFIAVLIGFVGISIEQGHSQEIGLSTFQESAQVIIDEKILPEAKDVFNKKEIVNQEKDLGELTIAYDSDITKTPGVFAYLSNELAANNISIIDSMICYSEHLIIVKEKELKKAFNVVFELVSKQ